VETCGTGQSDAPLLAPITPQELQDLPPVVDVPTAAKILGIGRTCAYELIRTDNWPTPVLRVGRLIRIPTTPLLELVGVRRSVSKAS
jgi:hypothetical protein